MVNWHPETEPFGTPLKVLVQDIRMFFFKLSRLQFSRNPFRRSTKGQSFVSIFQVIHSLWIQSFFSTFGCWVKFSLSFFLGKSQQQRPGCYHLKFLSNPFFVGCLWIYFRGPMLARHKWSFSFGILEAKNMKNHDEASVKGGTFSKPRCLAHLRWSPYSRTAPLSLSLVGF